MASNLGASVSAGLMKVKVKHQWGVGGCLFDLVTSQVIFTIQTCCCWRKPLVMLLPSSPCLIFDHTGVKQEVMGDHHLSHYKHLKRDK